MSIFMLPSTRDRIAELETRVEKSNEAYAEAIAERDAAQSELSVVKAWREADKRNAASVQDRLKVENERLESANEALGGEVAALAGEVIDLRNALAELRTASAAKARGGDDSGTAESLTRRLAAVQEVIARYKPSNPVVRAVQGALATPA